MSWEWVTLILGFFAMVFLLFGYVVYTQMRVRMFEAIPRTLPDMMASRKTEIREPKDGRA